MDIRFFQETFKIQQRHFLALTSYSIPLSFIFVFGVYNVFTGNSSWTVTIMLFIGCLIAPLLMSMLYKTLLEYEEDGYYIEDFSMKKIWKSSRVGFIYIAVFFVGFTIMNSIEDRMVLTFFRFDGSDEYFIAKESFILHMNGMLCLILFIMMSNFLSFIHFMLIFSRLNLSEVRVLLKEIMEGEEWFEKKQKSHHNSFVLPIMLFVFSTLITALLKIIHVFIFGGHAHIDLTFSLDGVTSLDKLMLVVLYAVSVIPNIVVSNFLIVKEYTNPEQF